MDIIEDCLCLAPVPYLNLAFRLFANIWRGVEQIQNCKAQLTVLAQCIAYLLRSLHAQYTSQRLTAEATATALLELRLQVIFSPFEPRLLLTGVNPGYLRRSPSS
jgi:prephenate dehydratase